MRYELPQTLRNFLYLYTLYKRRGILFLGKWTPPTILNLGSWKLTCTPTHMVTRYIWSFVGIGPKVPELGPKMWSKLGIKFPRVPELGPKMWSNLCKNCCFSALNCLIELKFCIRPHFFILLPPLSLSFCSKVKKSLLKLEVFTKKITVNPNKMGCGRNHNDISHCAPIPFF